LKNAGDVLDPRRPVAWWPPLILLVAGGGASLLPAVGGLPLLGFAGMALMLAGGVAGVPLFARTLLTPLARRRRGGVPRLLAVRHLHGAPGEAATALCGIVASTALMIAMATMVTSFRGAVDDWLGDVLGADLYARTTAGASFDPSTQMRLAATPGIATAAFSRQLPLTIAADRPPVSLIARPERNGRDPLLVLIGRAPPLPAGALPVWVSEPAQRLYGWEPGTTITLPIAPLIWLNQARLCCASALEIEVADGQNEKRREHRVVQTDGVNRVFRVRGQRPTRHVGFISDVANDCLVAFQQMREGVFRWCPGSPDQSIGV
jgi:putative ABC transport system permease protein